MTLSNVTGQLAALNLAGPHSREALAPLTDLDLSPEAFPYLGVREGEVCGVRALVMRVGFVGSYSMETTRAGGQPFVRLKSTFRYM